MPTANTAFGIFRWQDWPRLVSEASTPLLRATPINTVRISPAMPKLSAQARAEVKKEAHYIKPHAGGDGALRDAVEFILKAQGKWKKVVDAYLSERSPTVQ
jgi:hypothetical protein